MVKLPTNFREYDENGYENEDAYWTRVTALPAIRSWKQTVPRMTDHREHRAEIKIDALPNGRYLLLASSEATFPVGKHPLASTEFHVSNISFVNSGNHYFVLNRENGHPLPDARIQVWYSRYDYDKRRNVLSKGEVLTTDKNGYALLKPPQQTGRFAGEMQFEISTRNDHLFLSGAQQRVYEAQAQIKKDSETYEEENAQYFFFTDRSIYRPGQSLYFKAIGLTKDAEKGQAKIYKPGSIEITLLNANFEKVTERTMMPGEYGSVSGNFLLPSTGLTGMFTLQIKKGNRTWQQNIQVEEYKRPKFLVEYEPIKGTYKLNSEVTIKGMAKGYAGNPIDGAQVNYRVRRATRFMYPWKLGYGRGRYWPPIMRGSDMEIAHGTTRTAADGSFNITFTAI
ncbi:MAG TPA: MG2 domain-containing protein, partial [Phnomibacter sp.]|nr:MG2 domain-containing protein [Phnomibacter sp.]